MTSQHSTDIREHSRIMQDIQQDGWSDAVISLLDDIRHNSAKLSEYHRERYHDLQGYSKYFDIPVLILSVFVSSFSVGAREYVNQRYVSVGTCFVSLIISVITSIKLYLNIEKAMQNEHKMNKAFYVLSIDINYVLALNSSERTENGLIYVQKAFSTYSKLMEECNVHDKKFKGDRLLHFGQLRELDCSSLNTAPDSPDSTHNALR